MPTVGRSDTAAVWDRSYGAPEIVLGDGKLPRVRGASALNRGEEREAISRCRAFYRGTAISLAGGATRVT